MGKEEKTVFIIGVIICIIGIASCIGAIITLI